MNYNRITLKELNEHYEIMYINIYQRVRGYSEIAIILTKYYNQIHKWWIIPKDEISVFSESLLPYVLVDIENEPQDRFHYTAFPTSRYEQDDKSNHLLQVQKLYVTISMMRDDVDYMLHKAQQIMSWCFNTDVVISDLLHPGKFLLEQIKQLIAKIEKIESTYRLIEMIDKRMTEELTVEALTLND